MENSSTNRNISNLKVSDTCYKYLKKVSVDKDTSIQKVVQDILEKISAKKYKQELTEEV